MRSQLKFALHTTILASLILGAGACSKTSSNTTEGSAPADIESAYMSLSADVQREVLGVEAKSTAEVRQELLAKADKNGDGVLSEDEKSQFRAEWKDLREKMKADLLASMDKDKDGTVSPEEKKASLDALGQKIKAAIQSTLAEIRVAQEAAREKIKAACAGGKPEEAAAPTAMRDAPGKPTGPAASESTDPEAMKQEMDKALSECQTVVQAEKDKLHDLLKTSLDELHAKIDELKAKLEAIETKTQAE